jgi:hypothetical protein
MKRLIVALIPLALVACGPNSALNGSASGVAAPAPLAGTTADEKIGIGMLEGYDTFLTFVDALDAAGALPPTSAKARTLADLIDKTTASLRTAAAARRLGNSATYAEAFAAAKVTFAQAQKLLGN